MEKAARPLSRRTLFAGAGTVGAAAAAASLLPVVADPAPTAEARKEPPTRGGGYYLSEHVRRYFKTTLV